MTRLVVGIFACSAAWVETDASRELVEDIWNAFGGMSDKEICALLSVPSSQLSTMRSGQSAGPGIARWANLPCAFWLRFLYLRGRRFRVMVIEDSKLGALLETLVRSFTIGRKERAS
jgi:hypothetical protein